MSETNSLPLHRCLDCEWYREYPPHRGCYFASKWRTWLDQKAVLVRAICETDRSDMFESGIRFLTRSRTSMGVTNSLISSTHELLSMNELLSMQQQLVDKAPHLIPPIGIGLSEDAIKSIEKLLLFINSTGRKPWRPVPLDNAAQWNLMWEYIQSHGKIINDWSLRNGYMASKRSQSLMVSVLGMIEEAIEFYNEADKAEFHQQDQSKILEELTDIMFFFLEGMLLTGVTWEQIVAEYHRKWEVNIKRYKDGSKGDYSWDKRLNPNEEKKL